MILKSFLVARLVLFYWFLKHEQVTNLFGELGDKLLLSRISEIIELLSFENNSDEHLFVDLRRDR